MSEDENAMRVIWDGDAGQGIAVGEGTVSDGCDNMLIQRRRDGQGGGASVIVGDFRRAVLEQDVFKISRGIGGGVLSTGAGQYQRQKQRQQLFHEILS